MDVVPDTAGGDLTPLALLVRAEMRKRGWEPKDVHKRGMPQASVYALINRTEPYTQPPRGHTLEMLHRIFDLPMAELERAADLSARRSYDRTSDPEVIVHDLMAIPTVTTEDLERLTPVQRQAVAAVVWAFLTEVEIAMAESRAEVEETVSRHGARPNGDGLR